MKGRCASFERVPIIAKSGRRFVMLVMFVEADAFYPADTTSETYAGEHAMRAFVSFVFGQATRMLRMWDCDERIVDLMNRCAEVAAQTSTSDERDPS